MCMAKAQETSSLALREALHRNSKPCRSVRFFGCAFLAMFFAAGGASAQTVTDTLPAGANPTALAVNPVTNRIYVLDKNALGSVIVIDGATDTTTTVAAGGNPIAVAVNPVTNKIYVANLTSDNVTVIDGATNTPATISLPAGSQPFAVEVNPVTDMIYVINSGNSTVTVIDGTTNKTSTVALSSGSVPLGVGLNPVTNQIYVSANIQDPITFAITSSVTVIDGLTNSTTTVTLPAGSFARNVALNSITNKIYVASCCNGLASDSVNVIDGATNTVSTVPVGAAVLTRTLAVNPVTNKIYVANWSTGGSGHSTVTVIDGATDGTTSVDMDFVAQAVVVNPVTNQVYIASVNLTMIDGATNTATTAVPNISGLLAINPITNKIYMTENNGSVLVIDAATDTTTTVATGNNPHAVAVNPSTAKIYVPNFADNNVTLIDRTTNTTKTIAAGNHPTAVALNPRTDKIYVANYGSNNATVIDGATNATTTIAVGIAPVAIEADPVNNKIYVANGASNSVSVIDGASNTTTTIGVGAGPNALAVDSATNKVYVADFFSDNVAVIDGATGMTTLVAAGANPIAVALNPITNKIYVANNGDNSVTVIDGASNTTATVPAGNNPAAVAVNPVTNKIYVANGSSVTVIDGMTNTAATLAVNTSPVALAVNPASNTIYVVNADNSMTVIDGLAGTAHAVAVGSTPLALAVNSVVGEIYVANYDSANLTVVVEQQSQPIPLLTTITPLTSNATAIQSPTFSLMSNSTYAPNAPTPLAAYFQVDTWRGAWAQASGSNPSFSGQTNTLTLGTHVLYAFAADPQYAGSSTFLGGGSQLVAGGMAAYPFTVVKTGTTASLNAGPNPSLVGNSVTLTATVTVIPPGTGTPTGTVLFLDGATVIEAATLNSSGVATITTSIFAVGTHSIMAAYGGDSNFAASTSTALSEVVSALTPSFTISGSPNSVTVSAGIPASYLILATGQNNFSSAVALSCTAGLPTGSSCAFSPPAVTPGAAPATSTLTISSAAHTMALSRPSSGGPKLPLFARWVLVPALVLGFLVLAMPKRRMRLGYALGLLLVGGVLWQAGCGSSNSGGGTPSGTPAGTYIITVTGTSGATLQTASVTLVVQ